MVMQFGNKFIIPLTQSVCPWGSWRGLKWYWGFRRNCAGNGVMRGLSVNIKLA